jgi:tetratricopeptide (TPR) repeat protein
LKPDFSEAHNNLGLTLHEQGKWEEAIAAFKLALAFKTNFAEAHLNMARTLVEQGDSVSALAACQRALSIKG